MDDKRKRVSHGEQGGSAATNLPACARIFGRAAGIMFMAFALCMSMLPITFGASTTASTVAGALPEPALSTAYAADSSSQSFKSYLESCEDVKSIEPVIQVGDSFKESYLITVTQPISWDDPSVGTFDQRVEVNFRGTDNATVYLCGGYTMTNSYYPFSISAVSNELSASYNANFIEFEYRFFSKSSPEGLSNMTTDYWQYLTVENAAKDFHHVIEMLKPYLKGTSLFTGTSKGGYTTNVQACLFPDDCTCYVSYAAPFCNSLTDPRFDYNIFNTIGDLGMTAEDAAHARNTAMQFALECYRHRDTLTDKLWEYTCSAGSLRDGVTKGELFDMTILETITSEWQYGFNEEELQAILDESDESKRVEKLFERLKSKGMPDQWVSSSMFWPYYFQTYVQMGGCKADFSYLRTALAEAGIETGVTVTPEEEDGLVFKFILTPEQQATFSYSTDMYNRLLEWDNSSNTANVIMIFNGCDTWNAVRIPDTDSTSIHRYTVPEGNHMTCASALPAEQKAEVKALLDSWLLSNEATAATAPAEGGLVSGYTVVKGTALCSSFYFNIFKIAAPIVLIVIVIIVVVIVLLVRRRKRKKAAAAAAAAAGAGDDADALDAPVAPAASDALEEAAVAADNADTRKDA